MPDKKITIGDEIFFVASCFAAAPFIPAATIVVGAMHLADAIGRSIDESKEKKAKKKAHACV